MAYQQSIYDQVSSHYGNAARSNGDKTYATKVAAAFGYTPEELQGTPEDSNLGLSCGNPIALANLQPGETIVDLGSGAGFDVFQAARKLGPTGRAIGVDFNKEMLSKANKIRESRPEMVDRCSFIESKITSIPAIKDGSVDCVISNCVINLVPDEEKHLVFDEIFRILKPGGRVAVSDILAKGDLPAEVRDSMALYVGCISGASQVGQYETWLKGSGFKEIQIADAKSDLNVYGQTDGGAGPCCGPTPVTEAGSKSTTCGESRKSDADTAQGGCCSSNEKTTNPISNGEQMAKFKHVDFNQFAGSYKIYAVK